MISQLADAELVGQPSEHGERNGAKRIEPHPLIKAREQLELEGGTGLIAGDEGIAGRHSKPEFSGRQIGVGRLAARARLGPVPVVAVKDVAECGAVRRDKGGSRIIELQVLLARRQVMDVAWVNRLAVHADFFNDHGRRRYIADGQTWSEG